MYRISHISTLLVKRVQLIRAALDQEQIYTRLRELMGNDYWRVRVLGETTSTQDELKHELVSNGDCVVAEYQSNGRGRLDRSFESDAGVALLFSFYIEPPVTHSRSLESQGWIPLIAGMSVAATLNELTSATDYSTKWPNDVISESGKIAGVLCEKYGSGIIVGIGINVTTLPEELPVPTASSLYITHGIEIDRNELLPQLLRTFHALFELWINGTDLTPRYRALAATIGREVRVALPGGKSLEGKAIGVGAHGELVLESGDLVSVGDVVHLRSAL